LGGASVAPEWAGRERTETHEKSDISMKHGKNVKIAGEEKKKDVVGGTNKRRQQNGKHNKKKKKARNGPGCLGVW